MRWELALLLVALLLPVPVLAAAGSAKLLEEAVQHYQRGELREALRILGLAHQARRAEEGEGASLRQQAARTYLYEGICQVLIGKRAEARGSFKQALEHDPALQLDPDRFKPQIVELFEEVKAALPATLLITADTEAQVRVNGREAGTTPLRLKLLAGRHQIEVRADGRRRTTVVELAPGETRPLEIALLQSRSPPAVPAPAPAPATAPVPRPRRLWTWISMSASLVALTAAVAVQLSASAAFDELEATYHQLLATGELGRIDELRTSIRQRDVASVVMFSVAAALAVSAVVLFFLEGRAAARRQPGDGAGRGRARPVLGASGLQLELRF